MGTEQNVVKTLTLKECSVVNCLVHKLDTTLHSTLSHLDKEKGSYVRLQFIDYSVGFNTIVLTILVMKMG